MTPQEVFDWDRFEAWLRTKDPNEKFNYMNTDACLLAQYFLFVGISGIDPIFCYATKYIKESWGFRKVSAFCNGTFGDALNILPIWKQYDKIYQETGKQEVSWYETFYSR